MGYHHQPRDKWHPLLPPEISWPRHLVAQDHFWENVRRAPVEAEVPVRAAVLLGSSGLSNSLP